MYTLFHKITYILIPLLAAFAFVVTYVDNCEYDIYKDDLERKIIEFTKRKPDFKVVIAGDSRAEFQVMPSVVEREYNISTINIASQACDVVTMYNALKKYGLLEKPITVIVSSSIFQVNDGAIETGYISMAQLKNMPLKDKLSLFHFNIGELWKLYIDAFQRALLRNFKPIRTGLDKGDSRIDHFGFVPHENTIKLPLHFGRDIKTTKHSWYKNLHIQGARWKVLQTTLKQMSEAKCRFILYQPPVSKAFRDYVQDSLIDKYEKEFSVMMKNEISKYNNISFFDYYSKSPSVLDDKDYFDAQHFNTSGAEKFTTYLINNCIENNLIRHNTTSIGMPNQL